jgi:hypothetical protein
LQSGDAVAVFVDARDDVPEIGKARSRHQTDVPCPDHDKMHARASCEERRHVPSLHSCAGAIAANARAAVAIRRQVARIGVLACCARGGAVA